MKNCLILDRSLLSSLHGWEISSQFLGFFAFFLPASSNSLPLSIKGNRTLAVKVGSAPHRGLVAREGEHRKGNWDW
jgi:hypothetical protein